MAYINVAEWNPDQVTDWLKGLDNVMYHYVQSFTNNQVGGQQLLNIRPYELEQLGMRKIGHQEIVLEAVEHLRNFHYHLDKENLQFLALHVATSANCLFTQLRHHCDKSEIETQILNDISRTLIYIKPLVSWLDRSPFKGHSQFLETRDNILKFGLEMATVAQRDRFVENPVEQIRGIAEKLSKLANYIIQDITDPMVLQPASLDLVTLKKRESDLGFYILPSYHGVLRITDIKSNSPAHNSGKIEEGDEIVQINYQTVVGWQYKKVILQLQESPTDVLLTLKKRPKHTKMYGQIYMKPYRLPSKKSTTSNKWGDTNLPSPRPELAITDYPVPLLEKVPEKVQSDTESINSDISTPTTTKNPSKDIIMYMPKPRAVLQRRNTICGDQLSILKNTGKILFWPEKHYEFKDEESPSLRDKSISFGFGLELSTRPTTCIGISSSGVNGTNKLSGMKGSLPEMISDKMKINTDTNTIQAENVVNDLKNKRDSIGDEKLKTGVSKVVRFDSTMKFEKCHIDTKYTCKVDNTVLETFEPIPYVDEEINTPIDDGRKCILPDIISSAAIFASNQQKTIRMSKETGLIEAVNTIVINREVLKRGRLEKSHSTPAYDQEIGENDDIPPAIEPRKEYLNKTPPAPPPRPKRFSNSGNIENNNSSLVLPDENNKSKLANVVDLKNPENRQNIVESVSQRMMTNERFMSPSSDTISSSLAGNYNTIPSSKKLPPTKHFLEEKFEELELLTPNKTKSLTLKKKNSLLAKRRNVSIKMLGTSDIQGHLYRRTKDRHGVSYWAKLYFVLIDAALYGFKTKSSSKASCLMFLTGYTVSYASEVHSKPFAFKVYHPLKTLYLAAETKEALSQWMEYIRQATLKGNCTGSVKLSTEQSIKELYTETESSDDDTFLDQRSSEKSKLAGPTLLSTSKNQVNQSNTNSTSGAVGTSSTDNSQTSGTTKHEKSSYHLKFGSLKKFTKSNLPSFGSLNKSGGGSDKKLMISDVPVPTEQFRSYRKVPGNAGMQLGTNSMTTQNVEIGSILTPHSIVVDQPATPTNAHPSNVISPSPPQLQLTPVFRKLSVSSINTIEPETRVVAHHDKENDSPFSSFNYRSSKKLRSSFEYNYIHASNPNLVEFDFHTSKSLDHSLPKINPTINWEVQQNLQGCFTLEDLMLQKQAEEAQEMYNHRVYLGVEKKDERHRKKHSQKNQAGHVDRESTYNSGSKLNDGLKPVMDKIQSRSLPKTPDYAQSFKPDDKNIIMARSKEGQKLRDFGYEFISGDDHTVVNQLHNTIGGTHGESSRGGSDIWPRRHDKVSPSTSNASSTSKKKGLTWISYDSHGRKNQNEIEEKSSRQGSLKKGKNKLDNLKSSSEKLFQFKHYGAEKESSTKLNAKSIEKKHSSTLPSASLMPFTPMTLPLQKKSSGHFVTLNHNNIDGTASTVEHPRKNSMPEKSSTSYLSKLNFASSKSTKERKLLGSPRLHRAIFGRSASQCDTKYTIDHEIFSPLNKSSTDTTDSTQQSSNNIIQSPIKQQVTQNIAVESPSSNVTSPDYPNMEYPPVFEPETYSLSDPNISLTLIRRRNNNQSK